VRGFFRRKNTDNMWERDECCDCHGDDVMLVVGSMYEAGGLVSIEGSLLPEEV